MKCRNLKTYVTKASNQGVIGAKGVKRLLNDKDAEIKTKYDDYSVDELKEALKNTFFYAGEFSNADMEEMDQIMAALDRKEPLDPLYTAEESLKQFKETYSEELSSLGVRNTEEVMQEISAADSDAVCSGSKVKTVRPVRRRRLLRTAVVAAAVIMVLVAIAATASALGYNLFGWIPKWNDDVMGFGEEETAENELHDSYKIPAALEQLGFHEPVYPNWLPEDLELELSVVETDPLFLHESYFNANRYLSITIEPILQFNTGIYEKDDSTPYEHYVGNRVHYIVSDNDQYSATWECENLRVLIMGNISLEEMKRIIDSVYEGE